MGFVFTVTIGLIIWIALWSFDVKGFDAFMVTTLIVLLAATARLVVPFLPGRNQ